MLLERIDALRKEKGVSRRQISLACGFDASTISKWKDNPPKIDNLQKVADYFDVSVDYLTGKSDVRTIERRTYYTNDETAKEAQELSDDQHAVMKAIPHLPPQRVKILRAMLEEWKDTNLNG